MKFQDMYNAQVLRWTVRSRGLTINLDLARVCHVLHLVERTRRKEKLKVSIARAVYRVVEESTELRWHYKLVVASILGSKKVDEVMDRLRAAVKESRKTLVDLAA